MASMDESCVVELGSSLVEDQTTSDRTAWMEVEAQAADCTPPVAVCDVRESIRRTDWCDDAVAGYLLVDIPSGSAPHRVDFAFSLRHGGFVPLQPSSSSDAAPLTGELCKKVVYESLNTMLLSTLPAFANSFLEELSARLDTVLQSSAETEE